MWEPPIFFTGVVQVPVGGAVPRNEATDMRE